MGTSGLLNGALTICAAAAPIERRPGKKVYTIPYKVRLY